jgi:hypothetical protein
MDRLLARRIEADERGAKAAIYGLNRAGGRTREIEEAWIVHALVREDGLPQVEVAELLGRHKSWVCRRLALIEKLGPEARADLQVGLLTPTAARQLVRLPAGNQADILALVRRESLSTNELTGIVDLWVQCPARIQQQYILQHPREALAQEKGVDLASHDPRLSPSRQSHLRTTRSPAAATRPHGSLAGASRPHRDHGRRSAHPSIPFRKTISRRCLGRRA